MQETSARLLRVLSLLQVRGDWTSTELATRALRHHPHIRNDMSRCAGSAIQSMRGRVWPAGIGSARALPMPSRGPQVIPDVRTITDKGWTL